MRDPPRFAVRDLALRWRGGSAPVEVCRVVGVEVERKSDREVCTITTDRSRREVRVFAFELWPYSAATLADLEAARELAMVEDAAAFAENPDVWTVPAPRFRRVGPTRPMR